MHLPRSFRIFARAALLLVIAWLAVCSAARAADETLRVGSKRFTESYILAELLAQTAAPHTATPPVVRQGLGNTAIVYEALRSGAIDLYAEYTGTIAQEILKRTDSLGFEQIANELGKLGIGMTKPLGFNNTYALVMRRDRAEKLGITSISDLRKHPELKFGLTHEFLDRQDGWRPLAEKYALNSKNVVGIDHALGYAALKSGDIDIKDAYSTDAKISEFDLVVLDDDQKFFRRYDAVFLFRFSLPTEAVTTLRKLEASIDEPKMIRLNAEAERTKDYARAANLYFAPEIAGRSANLTGSTSQVLRAPFGEGFLDKLPRWTARHLELAGFSLLLAVVVGVPLGIRASRGGAVSQVILGFAGVVQTIPSLALLALLVPLPFFGISARTAIAALFLYGLLPIVRNTATGLQDIAQPIRDSATALGLSPGARLRKVYLPIASRSILAGIKTSAVINIGTATLAALIGAGGLGEPILSGLNLNDHATILQGAIPAAVLALLVQWLFDLLDRVLIPKGLRL